MDLRPCLLLLFFIVSARASCGEFVTPDPCVDPTDDNCADCKGADRVPNPFDCHGYYMCDGSSLAFSGSSFTCPDGEIFDATILDCTPGESCTAVCESTGSGGCLYTCITQPDYVAHPDDCSIYFQCDGASIGTPRTCPPTEPYFDGAVCQSDISKCCHCHPYCYPKDIRYLVPDPIDCRKYHACIEEGVPEIDGDCGVNEVFDYDLQICSSTAHCRTRCENVIGSDGCIDLYTCQAMGYFAKCPTKCWEEYYQCDAISDEYIDSVTCTSGYTFHPDLLVCVKEDTCSYP